MKLDKHPLENCFSIQYLKEMDFIYGIVYSYDSVQLKKIEDLNINKETLIEARYFNENKQLHLFKRDELEAVLLIDEENDDFFTETQLLMNNKYGKKLLIKNYLDYDKDGQAFISYSRPYDVIV